MSHSEAPPLRVLLVDDHEVVRDGVEALLQATEDIVVTGEAGSVREAIDEADRTRPDVVVMDVRLADGSGIEATREIRAKPETRCSCSRRSPTTRRSSPRSWPGRRATCSSR